MVESGQNKENMNRVASKAKKSINYPSLIRDEITKWERNQKLRLAQISNNHALRPVRGKGKGFCYKCHRPWTSVHTHVTINFKFPDSLKRYRQKCFKCNTVCNMHMPEEEFRRITRDAITIMEKLHLKIPKPEYSDDEDEKKTPPHKCYLCEKCNYGRGPCCVKGQITCNKRHHEISKFGPTLTKGSK